MAQWESSNNQFNDQGLGLNQHATTVPVDKSGNVLAVPYGSGANHQISAGNVTGYEAIHRCGRIESTPSTITAEFATIWDPAGDAATYVNFDYDDLEAGGVGSILTAVSNHGSDTSLLSGGLAKTIRLQGLDTNYDFLQEDISLYGAVEGTKTTNQFIRLDRAFVQTGSGTNTGIIDIYENDDSDAYFGRIEVGHGETFNAFYTVPRNKTGFLTNIEGSSNATGASSIFLFIREFGSVFRARHELRLEKGQQQYEFTCPIKVPEKSDIELRHKGPDDSTVSASFDLIVVDN